MSQVVCSRISKHYGNSIVLDKVDLEVTDGEFLVMLGPSGCGKSTLLRIIAGLEKQTSGDVFIGDKNVSEIHPRERGVAMVFQNYALYPLMTVYENLAFSLKIRKMAKADIDKRVQEVASMLGLQQHFKHRPGELSGGQRQRVAMGRAMVRSPRVFLFDEPLSNLDARLRAKVRSEIKSLHRSLSTTTIYVTHDQIEAITMGDRIMVMRNGGIDQIGSPDEIYSLPTNLYVATFVGSPEINVFEGVVDGGYCVIDGKKFPLPERVSLPKNVFYCIRPHDLLLADGNGNSSLAATVQLIEPTGGGAIIHAMLGEERIVLQISYDESKALSPGDTFNFYVNPDKIHLFDPKTENRIET